MSKLFYFTSFILLLNFPIQAFAQRGGCNNEEVPSNATLITLETTENTPLKSWYVCMGPLHYKDHGVRGEGLDTFYVDQLGILDLQVCHECSVIALAPATVMLYSTGGKLLELKCDSGVHVLLDGASMLPYPCTCNPFSFLNAPASCSVGNEEIFSESTTLVVYPNAVDETLTLHWKHAISHDIYFEMLTITMSKVMTGVFKAGTDFVVLPLASLQNGFYFLQLNDDAGKQMKSFMK